MKDTMLETTTIYYEDGHTAEGTVLSYVFDNNPMKFDTDDNEDSDND